MVYAGLDLGSTYSMVTVYNEKTKKVTAIDTSMDSPYVPSLVSWNGKKMEFGKIAKARAGKKGYSFFKAFKMLLSENDKKKLAQFGYTEEYTPEAIAELFIDHLLKKALSIQGETKIDRLVVGAPEIWFQNFNTMSGRVALQEICGKLPYLASKERDIEGKYLQVVSEPAAACAFFAYNYQEMKGNPFEGQILLIDYGGGTLDINLAKVTCEKTKDGSQFMEIRVLESDGAGENTERNIGKAGIMYMESVIEKAITEQYPEYAFHAKDKDGIFQKAVNLLEEELKNRVEEVDDTFSINDPTDPMSLEELDSEEFATVEIEDDELEISYGLLARAYNETIQPTFDQKLKKMITLIAKHGINYQTVVDDSFKISLVGGFSNFPLVKDQVERTFSLGHSSPVMNGLMKDQNDREQAIAKGCALIAARVIGIRQTAKFSIGILQKNPYTHKKLVYYAFNYKQEIEYGKVYYPFVTDRNGKKSYVTTVFNADGIGQLVINRTGSDSPGAVVSPKEKYLKQLKDMPEIGVIGFSLDASDTLTLHAAEYDYRTNTIGKVRAIPLGRYNEFFDLSVWEQVPDQFG